MLKIQVLLILLLIEFTGNGIAQANNDIIWGDQVLISDVPLQAPGDKAASRGHGKFGSEYARLLQLKNGAWLAAYTVSRNEGYRKDSTGGLLLEIAFSKDARHWTPIATIADPGRDLDNAQMIQCKDGSIRMACRSVRWQESYRLPVYKSADNGKTWERISIIDQNEGRPGELGRPDKGIYEPHFYFLDNGQLAVMYANEVHVTEDPAYSQIIAQKISPDNGNTWGKEIWVAYEPGHNASRPGMPVWTKMKNGQFIVVYEICGPEKCAVYYKTSNNGIDWSVGLGTAIPDQLAAPYILAATDGRLIVTSNAATISVSDDYGKHWHTAEKAFQQERWPALYQFRPKQIGVVTAVSRKEGGHNVQVRFGKVK